jgi:hypothetical protein
VSPLIIVDGLLGNPIFAPYTRIANGDGEIIQQGA